MAVRNADTILIRGANWLGDAVLTLPALNAVTENFPGSDLHILTFPDLWAIYERQSGVKDIIPYERQGRHRGLRGRLRLASELRRKAFDLAVLFPNSFDSALLSFLSGVKNRLGYRRDGRGILLTHPVRPHPSYFFAHKAFYFLYLLESAGLDAPFSLPRVNPGQEAERQADYLIGPPCPEEFLLAIAPGAAFGSAKRWPPEQFARAAALVLEGRSGRVIFLGAEGDAQAARKTGDFLARLRPDIVSHNLAGRTGIDGASALLRRSGLILTNDSGMMHLAGAVGTPLVAAFGPTDPLLYAPLERGTVVYAAASCAPCSHRECPKGERVCFTGVTPEKVAFAARKALETEASRQMNRPPAVFLYCDDTVLVFPEGPGNPDSYGSSGNRETMQLRPGSAKSIALLAGAGFKIVFIAALPAHLSGISGRAYQKRFRQDFLNILGTQGTGLDALYTCHYHSDGLIEDMGEPFSCPIPAEKFFEQAGDVLSIDLGRSFWVGETRKDIQAAMAFGGCGILVATERGIREAANFMDPARPRLVAPSLLRVAEWIICRTRAIDRES